MLLGLPQTLPRLSQRTWNIYACGVSVIGAEHRVHNMKIFEDKPHTALKDMV